MSAKAQHPLMAGVVKLCQLAQLQFLWVV